VPIIDIVAALSPRTREVGDLIGFQTAGRCEASRAVEELQLHLFGRFHQPALFQPTSEHGLFLEGQVVRRDMIGRERDGAVDGAAPVVVRLAGNAEHQVDRQILEAGGARRPHAGGPGGGVVAAPEAAQQPILERLHADRQPVDALLA